MLDQPLKKVMKKEKFLTAGPGVSVKDICQRMATKNAGAVLVVEANQLIGIFTERDVAFRVVAKGLNPQQTSVGDVMTKSPHVLGPEASYGRALLMMHENGFRHVPVVSDGRPIGVVSSRNAMDPDLEEFVAEARRREHHR